MSRGPPRPPDAYPLHLKNYISQCRDAERRRAAMTPNLPVNINPGPSVRSFGIPATSFGWTNHIFTHNGNHQEYKPFVPVYVRDPSGTTTFVTDNQQPTVPQPNVTYTFHDNNSATSTNHQQPQPDANYNVNNGQPPLYQYNFMVNPNEAQPYAFIPNPREYAEQMANPVTYNPDRIVVGSFSIRVPQSFEVFKRGENGKLEEPTYVSATGASITEAPNTAPQYTYTTTGSSSSTSYLRPEPITPPLPEETPRVSPTPPGIVIHCNGLVKYGNRTVGMIEPDVLRLTTNFIYDSQTMATPDTPDDAPAPNEEQRYAPNASQSVNAQSGEPSLVRPRYEDPNDYAENQPAAKRPRLDAETSQETGPQQNRVFDDQVITVEDDDDDDDDDDDNDNDNDDDDDNDNSNSRPSYPTPRNSQEYRDNNNQFDDEDNEESTNYSTISSGTTGSSSSPSRSSPPPAATVVRPSTNVTRTLTPATIVYPFISVGQSTPSVTVVYPSGNGASTSTTAATTNPGTTSASSTSTSTAAANPTTNRNSPQPTEIRSSDLDEFFVIPANMQFLFDSDRFRRLYFLYKLSAVKKVDDQDIGEKCVICLIDFEIGQTTLALRCGHKFHDNCIYMWCTSAATCPMCRRDIVDDTMQENLPNRILQNLEFLRYCLVRRRSLGDRGGLGVIAENDEAEVPQPSTSRENAGDIHIID